MLVSQDARFGPAPDAVDKPATDGFALAALLCALPGLVPFAVLFGIIALVRPDLPSVFVVPGHFDDPRSEPDGHGAGRSTHQHARRAA